MMFFIKPCHINHRVNFIEGGLKGQKRQNPQQNQMFVERLAKIKIGKLKCALMAALVCVLLLVVKALALNNNELGAHSTLELSPRPVVKQLGLVGKIEAKRQKTINAPFAGQVLESSVVIGQRVKKGDVLVQIDTREIQTKLNQAEVALIQAQQKFDRVKLWQNSLEMSQQRRELKKALALVEKAQRSAGQAKELFDLGIISKNEYDTEQESLASAYDQQISAKEQYQATLKKGDATQIEIVERELQNATYDAENIRKAVEAGNIVAPINGVILPVMKEGNDSENGAAVYLINQGDTVKEGQKLFLISTTDELQAKTKIDELEMSFIELGQTVYIGSDSIPNLEAEARVISIAHQGSENFDRPGIPLFDMLVSLDDVPIEHRQLLRLGGNVNIEVETYKNDAALLVPFTAIGSDGDEKVVQVLTANEGVVKRIVEIGISLPDGVEVLSGLNAGDVVLIPEG